jgi:catechol 2,3-dioxygenase-like lactoylglutathione lyase family enzyme
VVVNDIARARDFYERILKQTVVTDFGENIAFKGGFAIHQKDHFKNLIMNNPIQHRSNNFELYFEYDQIDEIVILLKNENIEFIHEIIEQPWKQRVIRFYDHDKNIIEIGERMEHVAFRLYKENTSIDEIIKTTYLSKESIENAIKEYSE